MLNVGDYKEFTCAIEDGYLCWQIILNDGSVHQIKYRYEKHITPAGNRSKRKVYFIRVNNEELIFTDEVKKHFRSFVLPYIRDGI